MFGNILISFVLAALVSFVMTPPVIKLAHKVGALDKPESRKIHKKDMPRIGGLAIIISFMVSIVYVFWIIRVTNPEFINVEVIKTLVGYLVGVILISIICFRDDMKNIRARYKLIVQVIAAISVIYSGVSINFINMFGKNIIYLPQIVSYIVTILWIIGITNAINLIDGLDGLASGISLISCVSLIIIFTLNGSDMLAIILITALAGAITGFLPYNLNPAQTFIGDIGSNFLGFSLAVFSILGVAKTYTVLVLLAPIIILGLPIVDVFCAIFRRVIKGKTFKYVMTPDRGHLHHRLIDNGVEHKQAVMVLCILTTILGVFSILLLTSGIWIALSFILIMSSFILIGCKDIIIKNANKKENNIS